MGTLRFLLALSVVVGHAYQGQLFGQQVLFAITAVQGFYIVSGFLITMVLNTRKEYLNIKNFYVSRYLRLWPTYLVVAALSISLFRGAGWFSGFAKLDVPAALFVIASNCLIFFQDTFLFPRNRRRWLAASQRQGSHRKFRFCARRIAAGSAGLDTWNRTRLLPDCAIHLPLAVAAARALYLRSGRARSDRLLVARRGSLVLQVRAGGDDVLCTRRPELLRRRYAAPVRSSNPVFRAAGLAALIVLTVIVVAPPASLSGLNFADIYIQSTDPVADRRALARFSWRSPKETGGTVPMAN